MFMISYTQFIQIMQVKFKGEKMNNKKIAEVLFPNNLHTADEYIKMYPKRQLKAGAEVTRYAPSPTGFMHLGNFFQAFISATIARMSNGVFYLRNEDTDQKRRVDGAMEVVLSILEKYNLMPQEYEVKGRQMVGCYGPYIQSERKDIYKAFAKKMVEEGKAFPCFCERVTGLDEIKKRREKLFVHGGCNVEKDPCRDLSEEEILQKIKDGKSFSIRLKSCGDGHSRIKFNDILKGEIEMEENAKDIILLKSDGLPTYHFAHPIDDTLMGTTTVVRGEEWLPSTPVHLEIFKMLNFKPVKYLHNPLICKKDGESKTKLAKRKKEADMRYYSQVGYVEDAINEYILSLVNSGFELWRLNNPTLSYLEYKFKPLNITATSPVLDLVKLNDISKEVMARLTPDEFFERYKIWARENDKKTYNFIEKNSNFVKKFINIDREKAKPRKDIYNFSMIRNYYDYMFEDVLTYDLAESEKENFKEFLTIYKEKFTINSKEEWFENIKTIAEKLGYATDNKLYKQNPQNFKGNTAKVCEYVRVAITGRKESPDLFSIMDCLGEKTIKDRINIALKI